ncbi:hypothetical protein, partial [Salmonella enterica]|uniref:hypothetical protein n=1 Tax=Salmonella enterica TaxID=28901 RepID=UPI003297E6D2
LDSLTVNAVHQRLSGDAQCGKEAQFTINSGSWGRFKQMDVVEEGGRERSDPGKKEQYHALTRCWRQVTI